MPWCRDPQRQARPGSFSGALRGPTYLISTSIQSKSDLEAPIIDCVIRTTVLAYVLIEAMAGSTLLFIEQTPSGLGSTERRAVRSHVMKGKNAGRPRPTYKQRRDVTHPSHKGDFSIPEVVIWHSFSLTAFPERMDPVSVKLMHRCKPALGDRALA